MSDTGGYIDGARTVSLHDVGGINLLAATLIGVDYIALAIVDSDRLGDGTPMPDPHCRAVEHEQDAKLPIEFVQRIAVAQRRITHRCGRPTRSGAPCRIPVQRAGEACAVHAE